MTRRFQSIPWHQVLSMIEHWANTPEGGYLGSSGGGKTLLTALIGGPGEPDAWAYATAKLKEDVECLRNEAVTLGWVVDKSRLLEVTVGASRGEIPVFETWQYGIAVY